MPARAAPVHCLIASNADDGLCWPTNLLPMASASFRAQHWLFVGVAHAVVYDWFNQLLKMHVGLSSYSVQIRVYGDHPPGQ